MEFYGTIFSLLPPIIAIGLALITKEVYSSLFVGIIAGGLLYSNFSFEGMLTHAFNDGIVASLADAYNVGILVFLVILGIMVMLMNRAGGSSAFGRWASEHIRSRAGAQLATIALGGDDLYRRLLQLPHGGQRYAPRDRRSQDLKSKARVHNRRDGGSHMYDRTHIVMGCGCIGSR